MADKKEAWTLGEIINAGSGLVLVGISFLTFAFLFPSTLDSIGRIVQLGPEITGIPGFNLTSIFAYVSIAAVLIIAMVSLFSLFFQRENISNSFTKNSDRKFYGFLMIYILIQLILTEIFAYFNPGFTSQFPFQESVGVQNFVFSFLTMEENVLFVLVPLSVALIIIGVMRGENVLRFLRFYKGDRFEALLISMAIALVSTLLLPGSVITYVSDFASFTVLNFIFLRFGFFKSFLTNFAVAMTNVTATLIAGNSVLSTALPLFLFFLGFLGVYSLVQVSFSAQQKNPVNDTLNEPRPANVIRRPQIEPFINSRCPECGNAVYHVILPNMSLKCEKCEHELNSDAVGEKNITIEMGRPSRY